MKIKLNLVEHLLDLEMNYTDAGGSHSLFLKKDWESEKKDSVFEIDIDGDKADITLKPIKLNFIAEKTEAKGFVEKTALKLCNKIVSAANDMFLHVGAKYRVYGLRDGDTLDITGRVYPVSSDVQMLWFDLYPVTYLFYEISKGDKLFELTDAFAVNREKVIRSARAMALADFGLMLIFTYPFHVSRVKRLTKQKKILKKLKAFNTLSEENRQKFFAKQDI